MSTELRRRGATIVAVALLAMLTSVTAVAAPAGAGCDARTNNTYQKLLECVRVDGVREHQAALQAIADANNGNRSEGTTGYTDSVDYVVETMDAAGWDAEAVPFTYIGDRVVTDQLTPVEAVFQTATFTGGGEGDVTGPVTAVDLSIDDPAASSSGCTADDFDGVDLDGPNDVVLLQRGACNFSFKAINAEAAGAEAVIIGNQGTDGRVGPYANVTLGGADVVDIPVTTASFAALQSLAASGATAHVVVELDVEIESLNVIAELAGANDDNVVMAGAHLDSVPAGPGINDNGSGSAALLEVGEQLAKLRPQNTVRFAWWGAEEIGLVGSTQYVNGLSDAELDRIALYLNFDMVGSPNYVFQVYDADESTFTAPVVVPPGSEEIEAIFESYYTYAGEPYDDSAFSGRSDYQAFINNGIPSSGLFTGAEVIKTPEQEAIWGGTAGDQFDPCYHAECDTFDNVSLHALDVNTDAIAFAVMTYAYSTEDVNGVPGSTVPGGFTIPEPAGPEGTFED
ncbi:M20/M25/M40 family metallo-hydrolase [Salsipaludibacter albus]|uniref:M20/M25/M40 family metallo-hydrolase n=1 Tax=Salsipaludibacter albus TaxID=2849650 RepID=UPI001EE4E9FC|nr:M20/M25/M40 family metallo-hydrolase [Salsipaludibacter albus]MBY5161417.1 M20/M25/M40 family metallo-hydrolase [Salsipaludibacter albus]